MSGVAEATNFFCDATSNATSIKVQNPSREKKKINGLREPLPWSVFFQRPIKSLAGIVTET